MSITVETIPFKGWPNVLRLSNGTAQLLITIDVGPRILSYTRSGGVNPLNIFEDQAGGVGEPVWRNRGGHRLWLAPESPHLSYCPDNLPVAWERLGNFGVRLTPFPETVNGHQKQIDLVMNATGAGVKVTHRVTRFSPGQGAVAPWALSVMAAGGTAIIPQSAFGAHPRDLLPNRRLILWPYTDLADPRYRFGRRLITLKQSKEASPTKIGLALRAAWAGYLVNGVLFTKHFAWDPAATYPDDGCNFEVFTNARMLELESLGPLVSMVQGSTVELVESWDLHEGLPGGDPTTEEGAQELLSFLKMDVQNGNVYE